MFAALRRLYDWVLSFGNSPYGALALFLVAFAESSLFPIPPDVLLLALAMGAPSRSLRFAAICTFGSVAGAALGYAIGFYFYELVGRGIIEFYAAQDSYQTVKALYEEWDAVAIVVAGVTPVPYKVFTIAAGTFRIDIPTFLLASIFSRGARFFLLAGLIWWRGPEIRRFIDRYFSLLTVVFAVLLVGGFILLRYAMK